MPVTPDYTILVDKSHPIPSDYIYTVHLVNLENVDGGCYQVEEKTFEAYKQLRMSLLADGIEIGVDSAYRSIARQQEIMAEFTEKYGAEYARRTVAEPGTSEHHTALALDIVPKVSGHWVVENEEMLALPDVFRKIHSQLPYYGFILRYPKEKETITGYSYEPWHLRYVGIEAAKEISRREITLEEYFSGLQEQ